MFHTIIRRMFTFLFLAAYLVNHVFFSPQASSLVARQT